MYRKVMLSLTLLSLILLSLIAWKVGVFKEIADLPFSTLVSNMVRNTYFSGMACSIISVVVIYKWQVWYSKRKLKQDFRCNECIQDIYSGIEIVSMQIWHYHMKEIIYLLNLSNLVFLLILILSYWRF